ncbi:MAG TPA: putative maltokinase [Bryobacteraceae bacterium]|nr:putative maltokinase [Bryobacteraceae bacterium]
MALPLITVDSWDRLFEHRALYQLEPILPQFITARRWFRSKARAIQCIAIDDAIPVSAADSCILILRIEYADGDRDKYVLPVSSAQHADSDELLAEAATPDEERRVIYGALSNPQFRDVLLDAIRCEDRWPGKNGEFIAARTSAFPEDRGNTVHRVESFVSRAEQSNTSIIYRDRYILKLFRKLEEGVNPDVEIGKFLTARGFAHTPAVLGTLEYRAKGGDSAAAYAAGILQQFVPNQGDAWKYTLEALSGFFDRARNRQAPSFPQHPFALIEQRMPADARELLGEYADSARLLGKRTAEMHAALTDSNADGDFAPESFTGQDAELLYEEMLGQADITFELLRRKEAVLTGEAAESARNLLHIEHRVTERFAALRNRRFDASRIRYHGDYHLGQVLYTGSDFMIIDFEGEPMRPLAHRRAKTLAMRDVAGMIRSFQYAAYSAPNLASADVEKFADYWTVWVSATYLNAYFEEAGGHAFVPSQPEERRILFDAFLLQKALYEVAYELNNRPDWVRIPLRGILSLMT